jgi:hypothetical protein
MSSEYYAHAMYGIDLRTFCQKLGKLYDDFLDAMEKATGDDEDSQDGDDENPVDVARRRCAEEFQPKFIAAFKAMGIIVPGGVHLIFTGDEDERPGRGFTETDLWLLGFGIGANLRDWPRLHRTFLNVSDWHHWVTA